ncbi:MAG: response regulator transcription factor, partial [Burkholderiales bacterium]
MAGPQRILLIDDDERLARMVVDYLHKAGFVVDHCADGAGGLERLQGAGASTAAGAPPAYDA